MGPRVLLIIGLSVVVGIVSAFLAILLQDLIGIITNAVFYQRWSTHLVAPGGVAHHWLLILLAPVVGGVIVGVMARYGSEQIRGHGMPEAIDAILRKGSKIQPRVAVLKPISAAVTIGTGGPFGAEGPIIMTGGAFGSLLSQLLKLTADERKALLVAGAAGGMAATFNAPLASILLAVELLLFEWKPRSYLPVATAVLMATLVRGLLVGTAAIFPVPDPDLSINFEIAGFCVLAGLGGGLLAVGATELVYFAEDTFKKLPIHWMWWPAIGGLIIGIGGLFEPRALGVGYDVIRDLLQGHATMSLIVGILVVKTLIWSLSLGSGTSGGVLAPVFMIGGSLGALEAMVFPHVAPGFWALMGLASVVGGVMRSPFTGVIFALELTHEWSAIMPLAIAASTAYGLSVLILKRSVLTEKVARKGFHLTREYSVDPLEILFVREVMRTDFISFRADALLSEVARPFIKGDRTNRNLRHRQRLYPVLDGQGRLCGLTTRRDMLDAALSENTAADATVGSIMNRAPIVAYPDQTLRELSYQMADRHATRFPVVDRADPTHIVGVVTVVDLLKGRLIDLQEERDTERVLHVRQILPLGGGRVRVRSKSGTAPAEEN
ncbi:MAG TPA: chloride channel protein [Stenotrophobium sp.]|nr:chloride channel protein [Stenotrophobium sp.]